MEMDYAWLIQEDEEEELRSKHLDGIEAIRPWDINTTNATFHTEYNNQRNQSKQFRCRIVRDESVKPEKKSSDRNSNLINSHKLKEILEETNRTIIENNRQEKTRQIRQVLRLHRSSHCQDIRHLRKRNPRIAFESVKCREFRADQSDLPIFGQSVRFDSWISRRTRLASSTSPVSIGAPQHLKFLFDKPKTRAGGASMNTRYSITKQRKFAKTESDEPSFDNSDSIMRITGLRLSNDNSQRSPHHTSYGCF